MIDHLHCYHCGGRIPESKDDVVLSNQATGETRFYHVDDECRDQADEEFFKNAGQGHGDWYIALRHAYFDPIESEGLRR